jgi:zinc transport system substrate-binding protein
MIFMFTHKLFRAQRGALVAAVVAASAVVLAACTAPVGASNENPQTPAATVAANESEVTPAAQEIQPHLNVLASFYPLQFVAQRVAGQTAVVENLTPPAADPHNLELSMATAGRIGAADLVVTLGGFQPAVDQAVSARTPSRVVDAVHYVDLLPVGAGSTHFDNDGHDHSQGHSHGHDDATCDDPGHVHDIGGMDPHFWTDPIRLSQLAQPIADALAAADPEHAEYFFANAAQLVADLTELDAEFAAALEPFKGAKLVTNHEAFGYLANRYHLLQVGVAGINHEIEPSPARLREIGAIIRSHGVSAVFYETLVSPRVVQTLASDLGITAVVLNTTEGLTPAEIAAGEDYLTIMRTNLATLVANLVVPVN